MTDQSARHFIPAWRPIAEAPPAVQGHAEHANISFGDSMAVFHLLRGPKGTRRFVIARGEPANRFDRFLELPPVDILIAGDGERPDHPADAMIAQIEERFPDWRSFRDLVDCIDVTLHELRGPASLVVKDPVDPNILDKLRDRKGVFMVLRAEPDHLADAWREISAAIKRADGDETGLVLACAMIERRRLRLGLQPIGTVEPDRPVPTVTTGDWPSGCHDPDSCARHQACMYVQCPRYGTDVEAAIVRHKMPCGRRGGSCSCQQEQECIHYKEA